MTTRFPAAFDSFVNPSGAVDLDTSALWTHAQQHADLNDAVRALEVEVGTSDQRVAIHAAELAVLAATGTVVWQGGDKAQTSTSGGANLPVVTVLSGGRLQVTTPVGNWCELTLPALRTARLLPLSLSLKCESPDWSKLLTLAYYIGTSGYANFWTRTWQPTTTGPSAGPECIGSGARMLSSAQAIMPVGGGSPVFDSTLVDTHKIRITPAAGESATIILESLHYDVVDNQPSLSIMFDDGYRTVINNALPLLQARGLQATMSVISDAIDSAPRYCTLAQLQQWRAAGMECVPHGPLGLGAVNNLAEYATVEEALIDMDTNRRYLVDNNLVSRGEQNFYVWPQGIRSMGGNLRDISLIEAAQNAGFIAARGTLYNHTFNRALITGYPQRYDIPIIGHTKDYGGNETTNITNLLAKIDELIDKKTSGCLLFHDVGASPTNSIDITTANFTTLMNRVALRVSQGLLKNPLIYDQATW